MKTLFGGFRGRLLLGALLPALLMVSMLEYVFLQRYRADIEASFRLRGEAVARQLAPAAEYALFAGDSETLGMLANATRESDPAILSVGVLGPGGRMIAQSGPPPVHRLPLHPHLQILDETGHTMIMAPILQIPLPHENEPVAWSGSAGRSTPVGYVVLEISRAELAERQREMVQITLMILLGGLLLSGWLSLRIAAGVLAKLDAAGIELQRQKEAAEALARIDTLTGLANRRSFDEVAHREIQRALRYEAPLALIMADLDHFKTINDRFGHHVGDTALKDFAEVLQASVRSVDLVARWGGEEFVILMPGTDLEAAVHAAERMRLAVAGKPLKAVAGSCGYTASFGVALLPHQTPTLDALLGRADAALYRAKEGGRNRVEVG